MRLALLAAVLMLAAACGPQRCPDPNNCFNSLVQFSAVKKIQVSGNFVYTYEPAGFERVPTTGGNLETLLTDATVHDFAVVPSGAYVATDTGLVLVDISGGNGHTTLTTEKTVAVAADQYGITYLTCGAVNHAALDGSQRISTPLNNCNGATTWPLAIDSSTAYGANSDGDWYASRSGGPITPFGTTPCFHLVAGGGWVYCGSAGLKRISPLNPDDIETVLEGDVRDFALGPDNIYVSVGTDLDAVPRSGGSPTVLGTQADITVVDVDSKFVYLVNTDRSLNLGLLLSTPL